MNKTKKTCGNCRYFDGFHIYCEKHDEDVDPYEKGCSWFKASKISAALESFCAAIDAASKEGE